MADTRRRVLGEQPVKHGLWEKYGMLGFSHPLPDLSGGFGLHGIDMSTP